MSSKIKFNLIQWRNPMPNEKTYEQVREEWVDSQESTKKVLELRKKGFKLQDKIQRDIKRFRS